MALLLTRIYIQNVVPINRSEWGKLMDYEDDGSYKQGSPEGEIPPEEITSGIESRSDIDTQSELYTDTLSGTSSVPGGLETPESIELRKSSRM